MLESSAQLKIGRTTITPLLDGIFPIGFDLIPDADCTSGHDLLRAAGRPAAGPSPEPVFAYLAERDGLRTLIDAGCGSLLGAGLGQIDSLMRAMGIEPQRIDRVVLTHMHPDHIGGMLQPDGTSRFPKAEIVVHESEVRYWQDEEALRLAPVNVRPYFAAARGVLHAYKDQLKILCDELRIDDAMWAWPLPGHTPGHMGILIDEDGERLLIWGDVVHSATLQLAHPEWAVAFDVNPDEARLTRSTLLECVAVGRLKVAGMHMGEVGYMARRGRGYELIRDSSR
ncbi:MBL fold metallo-hydrolase [Burkholderia plantarii]|uniref:MBL fold metallo-hydrolase n=1 Tax=Burkholderia plantarii TaxID=41899 RepID=UPI0018DCCA60|nr:MBL fold metallo-hydrolase [Burkholderia plantarii]MBI0329550.1 MBL fold metallo-hydrolase [Burkholderia plantarii]